jgi:phosphoheptose isomerase
LEGNILIQDSKAYYDMLLQYLPWLKTVDINSICDTILGSKMVFTAGNGGSGANAAHLACELQKGCGVPTICLNDSTQLLTAWSNDYSYGEAMVGQYRVIAKSVGLPHTVIVFSGSGDSSNLLTLTSEALNSGSSVIALTGYDNLNGELPEGYMNTLDAYCRIHEQVQHKAISLCIGIPKSSGSIGMQVAEDIHGMLLHMIYIELLVRAANE